MNVVGVTPNVYLFTGEQWDADLGMYFLRARYLNPETGRFHTMDTFEGVRTDPQSLHKYLYAHANPVMFIDPSGESVFQLGLSMALRASKFMASFILSHPIKIVTTGIAAFIGATVFAVNRAISDWWGHWGGAGKVNGKIGVWNETDQTWPIEGEEGFVIPKDKEDWCYYHHDLDLRNCANISSSGDRKSCRCAADKALVACLRKIKNRRKMATLAMIGFKLVEPNCDDD